MTTPETTLAIFSPEWCAQAEQLFVTDVIPFIKDPEHFNYTAEFRLVDGPGCQFQTEKGQMVWWKAGTDHLEESTLDFLLQGREEHWNKVIAGDLDPIPAIAAKRLHLVRGPMDTVIKEVDALKRMLGSWSKIGTSGN